MKQERANFTYQSQQQQMMYQNHQQADHNHNSVVSGSSSALVDPLAAMNPPTNLLRQSSSPAGFFEHVNMGNGTSIPITLIFLIFSHTAIIIDHNSFQVTPR